MMALEGCGPGPWSYLEGATRHVMAATRVFLQYGVPHKWYDGIILDQVTTRILCSSWLFRACRIKHVEVVLQRVPWQTLRLVYDLGGTEASRALVHDTLRNLGYGDLLGLS